MAQTFRRGPVSGSAAKKNPKRKPFLLDLYSTAVGKKYVMAITGLIGVGFIVGHMVGNLKLYIGLVEHNGHMVYDMDVYGAYLRELLVPILPHGVFLWIMRIVLLGSVLLHVHSAWGLTVLNRRARPDKYRSEREYVVASFASRSMRWTGIIVFAFIIWHLADLTWGWVNPGFEHGAVQRNVVASFRRPLSVAFYVIANILLGIHLFHGIWSLFQSLGINSPRFNPWRRGLAAGIAAIVVLGNVSFPLAVAAGVVNYDPSVPSLHEIEHHQITDDQITDDQITDSIVDDEYDDEPELHGEHQPDEQMGENP